MKTHDMKPDCGFMSVSTNAKNNVFTGRQYQLQIEIPKGTPLYVTENYMESECILARETKLAFISAKMEKTTNGNIMIIRCRVMP